MTYAALVTLALGWMLTSAGLTSDQKPPVMVQFLETCLPHVEAETNMPEGQELISDTHILRWRMMKTGWQSCIVDFREDYSLPDNRWKEEMTHRRDVAQTMLSAAPLFVEDMRARGYEVCFDQARQENEVNIGLRKPLSDGRAVSALIWMLPDYPIAVMNAGILSKEQVKTQSCQPELS